MIAGLILNQKFKANFHQILKVSKVIKNKYNSWGIIKKMIIKII